MSYIAGIVLAHGKQVDAWSRHYHQNWTKEFDRVITISPRDDSIPGSIQCGPSSKNGPGNIDRMLLACAIASRYPAAAVLEYDTLVYGLRGEEFFDGTLHCSELFANTDPSFSAEVFGHSPWVATRHTWAALLQAQCDMQGGWPDRWLALAAKSIGVEMRKLQGSYSCDRDWEQRELEDALWAKRNGALAIHGFKYKQTSEIILSS